MLALENFLVFANEYILNPAIASFDRLSLKKKGTTAMFDVLVSVLQDAFVQIMVCSGSPSGLSSSSTSSPSSASPSRCSVYSQVLDEGSHREFTSLPSASFEEHYRVLPEILVLATNSLRT